MNLIKKLIILSLISCANRHRHAKEINTKNEKMPIPVVSYVDGCTSSIDSIENLKTNEQIDMVIECIHGGGEDIVSKWDYLFKINQFETHENNGNKFTKCGSVFHFSFWNNKVYGELFAGPNFEKVNCGSSRLYYVRIQKPIDTKQPEPWKVGPLQ